MWQVGRENHRHDETHTHTQKPHKKAPPRFGGRARLSYKHKGSYNCYLRLRLLTSDEPVILIEDDAKERAKLLV